MLVSGLCVCGDFASPVWTAMAIYSLYLISKSGSLLYQRDFKTAGSPITKQKSNDYLIIASNLHGIHAIASKLTPAAARGSLSGNTGSKDPRNGTGTSGNSSSNNMGNTGTTTNSNSSQLAERADQRSSTASIPLEDESLGFGGGSGGRKNTGGGINVHSNKTGLRCVNTEKFNMFVHQTVTGVKVIILTSTDLSEPQIAGFQTTIHRLYADYVMKNPFYSLDMPIRIKLFDDRIMSAVINYNIK